MKVHLKFDENCRDKFILFGEFTADDGTVTKLTDLAGASRNRAIHAACILLMLAKARKSGRENYYSVEKKRGTFLETLGLKVQEENEGREFCELFGLGRFLNGNRGDLHRKGVTAAHVNIVTNIFALKILR